MSARGLAALATCAVGLAVGACDDPPAQPSLPSLGGDAVLGQSVIAGAGCGACHSIPGVRGARGLLAPPLDRFSRRAFIAGELPNTPANLVRWISDPTAVHPRTAMPSLGLDDQQLRDVAAYLYTLD